jgi:hypothetical protein
VTPPVGHGGNTAAARVLAALLAAATDEQRFCDSWSNETPAGSDAHYYECGCGALTGWYADEDAAVALLDEHLEEQQRRLREFTTACCEEHTPGLPVHFS